MPRLIDADALIKAIHEVWDGVLVWDESGEATADEFEGLVYSAPTIEAEPVRHGRWIWDTRLGEHYCSECQRMMKPYVVEAVDGEYRLAQPGYCGWCGAKMEEVVE